MTTTGLFFIPSPPNTTTSPAATLVSHISRKFPTAKLLPPFFLDHKLFVDTSSLLPGSNVAERRYVQLLNISHSPGITSIGSSSLTANGPTAIVEVPSGAATEGFYDMVSKKMQPLWAPRQNVRIDGGTGMELSGGSHSVRIGELKIVSRQGQGNVRGVVVEIYSLELDGEKVDWDESEGFLKALFAALMQGSGVSIDGLRMVVKIPLPNGSKPNKVLTRQYMELLRFARAS